MALLQSVIPKLPSTNLQTTRDFYVDKLKFKQVGQSYPDYLMLHRDEIELHFFRFDGLNPLENYGMSYIRVKDIDRLYDEWKKQVEDLEPPHNKPWGQREF